MIEVRSSISDDYEPTRLFTIVLILHYLLVSILVLSGVTIFIFGMFFELPPDANTFHFILMSLIPIVVDGVIFLSSYALNSYMLFIIPLVALILAGILFWSIYVLQDYKNAARKILLALNILNLAALFYTFSIASIVGIVIELFVLYVLLFDKDTVRLFQ